MKTPWEINNTRATNPISQRHDHTSLLPTLYPMSAVCDVTPRFSGNHVSRYFSRNVNTHHHGNTRDISTSEVSINQEHGPRIDTGQ